MDIDDIDVTLSREQVKEILNALHGIEQLLKRFRPKSGNAAEAYAIMSNISVIQAILSGMPRVRPN
jgi:hypothetical protein